MISLLNVNSETDTNANAPCERALSLPPLHHSDNVMLSTRLHKISIKVNEYLDDSSPSLADVA